MDATNSKIMDQICKFNEKIEKLQSELTVAKEVNSVLSERKGWSSWSVSAGQMYSIRECLELVGVLHSVRDSKLEEKVLKIFEKDGHRLKRPADKQKK